MLSDVGNGFYRCKSWQPIYICMYCAHVYAPTFACSDTCRMRRSLSDTALSGGEALVPTPLPAMRNSASKAPAFPARRSSLDPEASAAARQARGGSPGETVSSSLGSRAERAVLSARLKQVKHQ